MDATMVLSVLFSLAVLAALLAGLAVLAAVSRRRLMRGLQSDPRATTGHEGSESK